MIGTYNWIALEQSNILRLDFLNVMRTRYVDPSFLRFFYQNKFRVLIAAMIASILAAETSIFGCPSIRATCGEKVANQKNLVVPVVSQRQTQSPKNAANSYRKAFAAVDRLSKLDRAALMKYDPKSDLPRHNHLNDKLKTILGHLSTATSSIDCDWENRLKERGAAAAFPQLSQSKSLAAIATAHAQSLLDEKQIEKAIEIFQRVLIMAHHVGDDGQTGLVGLTTRYQIEQSVFDIIRPHIQQLSKHKQLGGLLSIALKKETNLPKFALLLEREVLLPWYRKLARNKDLNHQQREWRETYLGEYLRIKGSAWILEQIEATDQHYIKAGQMMELKFDQWESQFERYKLELRPLKNPFSQNAIVGCPGIPEAYYASRKLHAEWTMLKVSAAMFRKGNTAIKELNDPFGDGPFEFKSTSDGFSLTSKLIIDGNRLTIRFD